MAILLIGVGQSTLTQTVPQPRHQINMINLLGATAIFVCGFSHLIYRIHEGTVAFDRPLLAELVASLFFMRLAEEYGNIMERAAGN